MRKEEPEYNDDGKHFDAGLSSKELSHVEQFLSSTRIFHFVLFVRLEPASRPSFRDPSIRDQPSIHSSIYTIKAALVSHLETFFLHFSFTCHLHPEPVSQLVDYRVETRFEIC